MSLESVREFFRLKNLDIPIIELDVSTATVALAAEAHGVEHGRIAKTLAFRLADGRVVLLVASGDARILSGNIQAMASYTRFGFEPYTLDPEAGQASFMHKWLSREI